MIIDKLLRYLKAQNSRPAQLLYGSLVILKSQGILTFILRLLSWLGGHRRHLPSSRITRRSALKLFDAWHNEHIPDDSPFMFIPSKDPTYQQFIINTEPGHDELINQREHFTQQADLPLFSVITPVYNVPLSIFRETVQSVRTQTYSNWEWIIVDASTNAAAWKYLCTVSEEDPRIKAERIENGGISRNSNIALQKAVGDYLIILDHDDLLAPNALFEVASALISDPDIDVVYSDLDKLDAKTGRRCDPFLKPGWSPELMLSASVMTHLCAFRRELVEKVGDYNPAKDGAQDWDLYLRISEHTDTIHHIPKILYHWRRTPDSTAQKSSNKPYAHRAQIDAVSEHLVRTGVEKPNVYFREHHRVLSEHPIVEWMPSQTILVSIIIPTRDKSELLSQCLTSILSLTSYPNYEIVIADTGSEDAATWDLYKRFEGDERVRIVRYQEDFNFSKVCNFGAEHARGGFFLFLNNDTEILDEDWLERLVQWFDRKGVGIVGAKLLYPNQRIQHAGVIVGFGGLAGHIYINEFERVRSVSGSDDWCRNLSAVTGACLLISREVFEKIDGFDTNFVLNYSDVDLCLRVHELGYRIVYTPFVRIIHYEGQSHNHYIPRSDFERASSQWKKYFQEGDPYYNLNLSYSHSLPTLRLSDEELPDKLNQRLMERLPKKDIIKMPDDIV